MENINPSNMNSFSSTQITVFCLHLERKSEFDRAPNNSICITVYDLLPSVSGKLSIRSSAKQKFPFRILGFCSNVLNLGELSFSVTGDFLIIK